MERRFSYIEEGTVNHTPIPLPSAELNYNVTLLSEGEQVLGNVPFNVAQYSGNDAWLADGGSDYLTLSTLTHEPPVAIYALINTLDGEDVPGTYASTTETADFILTAVQLKRHPVLQWGPGGMQMLSETRAGGLTVLGFAGNTAPDHVDHFHGLPEFLKQMLH